MELKKFENGLRCIHCKHWNGGGKRKRRRLSFYLLGKHRWMLLENGTIELQTCYKLKIYMR